MTTKSQTTLGLCALLLALCVPSCGGLSVGDNALSISDGTMMGLNGWSVSADIDVEPNRGALGTPVKIRILFRSGGENVSSIETWQATAHNDWTFVRTAYDGYLPLDPARQDPDSWATVDGVVLTGIPAIVRYYALSEAGTRIALGDIDINGGRP